MAAAKPIRAMIHDRLQLFTGNANPELAASIAEHLGTGLGKCMVKQFSDGEIYLQIQENVRGGDVFIIQPTCTPHSKLPKDRPASARDLEDELVSLMSDVKRPDSLASNLAEAHRVGGNVRERLSSDMSRLVVALAESARIEDYMLFVEYSAILNGCLEQIGRASCRARVCWSV